MGVASDSHAEVRTTNGGHRFGRSADVDVGCILSPENVEQHFAGQAAQSSSGFAAAGRKSFAALVFAHRLALSVSTDGRFDRCSR